VIFANDPHIGFRSQNMVWSTYSNTWIWTIRLLFGKHHFLCWDITGIMLDHVWKWWYWFLSRVNSPRDGNKYKTPAGFSDYTIREEIIKVKTLLM
jgi:penicillin amidase